MTFHIITFEDIHTRFGFAWATSSHASLAAKEFFALCRTVFPHTLTYVLTDNGSEFKKHFAEELKRLLLPEKFNIKFMDYLAFYNTERVHFAFGNKLSPIQYMLSLPRYQLTGDQECKSGWTYTMLCNFAQEVLK